MGKAMLAIGVVGGLAAILSVQTSRGQDTGTDLMKRIVQLERRVAALERLVVNRPTAGPATVAEAELKLATALEQLEYSERLFRKGFVASVQLEADKFVVSKAQKELELAKSLTSDEKTVLEIVVLDAEQELAIAKENLRHSERLRSRGFVTELEVEGNKLQVKRATERLRRSKEALKAYQKSDDEKN